MTRIEWEAEVQKCKNKRDEEIAALNKKYRDELSEIQQLFERDCEEFFGFKDIPEAVKSRIHYLAYEEGHSGGFSNIVCYYGELVEFAKLCRKEFSK